MLGLSIALTLGAAGAVVWAATLQSRKTEVERVVHELSRVDAGIDTTASTPMERDFVGNLPADPPVDPFVERMHESSAQRKISIVQVAISPQRGGPRRLGRAEVSITARGRYDDVKRFMADILALHSAVVLQRVEMRRVASGAELETRIEVSLLSRPSN